jgi:hypothetical protein
MRIFAQKSDVRSIFPIGIFLLLTLSGCNQNSLMKKLITPQDEAVVTNCVVLLQQNKLDQVEKNLDSSIKNSDVHANLIQIASLIPAQEPKSIKFLGVNAHGANGQYSDYEINYTFEYQFPSKWLLINVVLHKNNGVSTIIGLHVNSLSDSLENLNRFTLAGKNFFQYAIFALAVLIPIFILYALVLCIRTKMKKRKWLWIIFIILGLGQFTVNWTTGEWHFVPLSFAFFGVAAAAPMYMTWFISISLPLGAIIFLIRRRKIIASNESADSTL